MTRIFPSCYNLRDIADTKKFLVREIKDTRKKLHSKLSFTFYLFISWGIHFSGLVYGNTTLSAFVILNVPNSSRYSLYLQHLWVKLRVVIFNKLPAPLFPVMTSNFENTQELLECLSCRAGCCGWEEHLVTFFHIFLFVTNSGQ